VRASWPRSITDPGALFMAVCCIESKAKSGQPPDMLDLSFDFRISAADRQELTKLADAIGVSAADVVRLGIRRMAAEHLPAKPSAPTVAPSLQAMDLPALLVLRDTLGRQTSPEASCKHAEVNQEIIKRQMAAQRRVPE